MRPGDLVRPTRRTNAISVMRPTYAPYETTLLTPEMTVLLVETHASDVDIGAGRTTKVMRVRVLADGRLWWLAAHNVEVIDEAG
jgi:hypothetical protein